jgi:hypothetical protein
MSGIEVSDLKSDEEIKFKLKELIQNNPDD